MQSKDEKRTYDAKRYNKNKTKMLAQSKDWVKRNKKKAQIIKLRWDLKKTYGITLEDYEVMNSSQNSKCKICDNLPEGKHKKLYVDHDHSTNKIRALLCHKCNVAVGMIKEDINTAKNLLKYLEEHKNA